MYIWTEEEVGIEVWVISFQGGLKWRTDDGIRNLFNKKTFQGL